jgi:Cdc6-like AAA superfamily ATPase
MLNFSEGKPIAHIIGGHMNGEIIYISEKENNEHNLDSSSEDEYTENISLTNGNLSPLLNPNERTVAYIAGPSGSGKTTYAVNLIKNFNKIHPKKPFYLFSRSDHKSDPAFKGLKVNQVIIDENLIEEPIDITEELTEGSILLFDDCNTIQNDKIKHAVDKLMSDIMEIGRKLDITIIITNHLVIPNEKKVARTIMNELQLLTIFPKSGSSQQINYALKTYFGLNNNQIQSIISIPSRWITISKTYPMYVLYDKGCFIL